LYLKDAAVFAGLGCIGRNNLLVSPDHGPRIRLRALLLDAGLEQTGLIEFDPCPGCDEPCRDACPEQAFERRVLSAAEAATDALPARDGTYSRSRCFVEMGRDVEESQVEPDDDFMTDGHLAACREAELEAAGRIRWCRRCEPT
jgi:epoxyqueuosine reductase